MTTPSNSTEKRATWSCSSVKSHLWVLATIYHTVKTAKGGITHSIFPRKSWTRAKKGNSQRKCPKCHRTFIRLDTHLRNSAFCGSPGFHNAQRDRVQEVDSTPESHTTAPAQNPANSPPSPPVLPILKLPIINEEWSRANSHFEENLVPPAMSVEVKNNVLVTGIYEYFEECCGTRLITRKATKTNIHRQKKMRHERAGRYWSRLVMRLFDDLLCAKFLFWDRVVVRVFNQEIALGIALGTSI